MKSKLSFLLVALIFSVLTASSGVYAANVPSPNTVNKATKIENKLPANIKSTAELTQYLQSKGIVKTIDDLRNYMKNNKAVFMKINPKLIDYGFTFRMYAEINDTVRNDGSIKVNNEYGSKNMKAWVVPVVVVNLDKQTQEISRESFSLVPNVLLPGKELNVLVLEPECIIDTSSGNIINNKKIKSGEEVHVDVLFHVSIITSMEDVKLRMYDGKDHTDIKIVKQ
ncbi:hypothetical protein O0550_00390 [Brevibacillus halotolerans]|uniref:hypothetical protein n=1 Tax=Brevibacillus TaxID=55080 RepID=UPI00215D2A2C|nr:MULTISPECIES: hypothetical protein [Brevibacillus]MCR8961668.1 hypothetical protein [Brevibacillus laterosporus]MCZ0833823.1 hypothetical protein [Brevibacillus halotolerans]